MRTAIAPAALTIAALTVLAPPAALAQDAPHDTIVGTARPPPTGHAYLQYGVAFTIEGVADAGPACSVPSSGGGQSSDVAAKVAAAGCILGSGGGVAIRLGWRPTQAIYFGGAYELSKQDPNNLYRLAILQQARVEGRRYFDTGWRTRPYATIGAGVAGYGNEWSIDTWGITGAIGGGVEFEFSGAATMGFAIVYRPLYLRSWVDSSLIPHQAGIAHLIGFELALEVEDRQ